MFSFMKVMEPAGHGFQRGGFSRAIRADQRDDFALMHLKRYALNGMNRAVIDVDVFHFQHIIHLSAVRGMPR